MIRYALDENQIRSNIILEDATWFAKTARRTAKFKRERQYAEKSTIWSAAKPAFMIAQKNKCLFCERAFSGPNDSRIEMDLEHFRPKSSVTPWVRPLGADGYPEDTGQGSDGYYWLAYDISNYAASCKTCNTLHKSNCFPIAGTRLAQHDAQATLSSERPYLCYPLGDQDEDPENIITFAGTIAIPAAAGGFNRQRGLLIIDFFGLNRHDLLHIERAQAIERFGLALLAVSEGRGNAVDQTYVQQINNPMIPHAGCLRAFGRLWQREEQEGRRILSACRDMLAARLTAPNGADLAGIGADF
ncbi:hypothetical protein G6L13_30685 [Agrobacterium tumefaciens]|uniref:hypothetical protein n=1 Tax=Agrobacterium tumefaciens TaxID=358 RepID=UPI0015736C6A|nr:hypothetical protein [Agrobacterium tumefaciens]NTA84818.1 hypothetical protein [Agrobacterium tumefaciens]